MDSIAVYPATADRFDDAVVVLGSGGGEACCCQYWRMASGDYSRSSLEAYPVDTRGARIHGTAAYVGTTGMFEDAGFRRVLETDARSARLPRWLMRLDLRV